MSLPEEEMLSIPRDESTQTSPESDRDSKCRFQLTKKLGDGSFGTVKLGINQETGEAVAIKIIEKNRIIHLVDKSRIEKETNILKFLRHPNIVHFYDVLETEEKICLIMEYVPGKELFNHIVDKKKLSEKDACKIFQQIISGLEYIHKLGVVHRDIKPENILIDPISLNIKIVDFGLSNLFRGNNFTLKSSCGSPCYAAPEMLFENEYRPAPIDVWASGIVLYAMVCGYLPFEDDDNEKLYRKIREGKFELPNFLSKQVKDLISRILNTNPNKRLTINQIKIHDWFNFVNPSLNMSDGLLINTMVIPVDEDIVNDMVEKYGFPSKVEVRKSVLSNRHNDITVVYYLALRGKISQGKKSVADLKSDLFKKYAANKDNLFEKYNYDFSTVVEARKNGTEKEKEKENSKRTRIKLQIKPNKTTTSFSPEHSRYNLNLKIKHLKTISLNNEENNNSMSNKNNLSVQTHSTSNRQFSMKKKVLTFAPSSAAEENKHISIIPKMKKQPLTTQNKNVEKISIPDNNNSNNKTYPIDLSCISFKCQKVLLENVQKTLKSLKIKFRTSGKKIIIEKISDNLLIEIFVSPVNEDDLSCYTLKFKRLMGGSSLFSDISKKIISKVDF